MFIYTIDEKAKDMLLSAGCTLVSLTYDIEKKPLWCLKKASQFTFDINNPVLKDKSILSDSVRIDF